MSSFQVPLLLRPFQPIHAAGGLATILTKEILGINSPKIALGFYRGGPKEGLDNFVSEFGNTVGYFGGGMVLDWGLSKLRPLFKNAMWFNLGKSLALFSTLGAFYWAMPFLRNYITAKTSGSTQFKDVINEEKNVSVSLQNPPEQKENLNVKLTEYRNGFLKIQGIGVGIGVAALALTALASHKIPWKGLLTHKRFNEWFILPQDVQNKAGKFWGLLQIKEEQSLLAGMNGPQSLFFWGIPAYIGWYQASRDELEKKEVILKFFGFLFGFYAAPKFIGAFFGNPPKKSREDFNKYMASVLTSIVALGFTPQAINIYLTKKRLEREPKTTITAQKRPDSIHPKTIRKEAPSSASQSTVTLPAVPALTALEAYAGVPSPFRLPSPVWPQGNALQPSPLQAAAMPPIGWVMPPVVLPTRVLMPSITTAA